MDYQVVINQSVYLLKADCIFATDRQHNDYYDGGVKLFLGNILCIRQCAYDLHFLQL